MSTSTRLLAVVAAAVAAPALAYVPPATTVLRDAAKARDQRTTAAVEARGRIQLGDATPIPATLWVKSPGRCRLELALPGASPAERPTAVVRNGKVTSARSLDQAPAAVALTEAVCALLGGPRGEGADRAWAQALSQHGVAVGAVAFGHLGPQVAYVLGGPASSPQPQAWFEKQALRPVRLTAELGGARRDVRLDWSGAEATFPAAIEVREGERVAARFTVERTVPNPRVPDSMF